MEPKTAMAGHEQHGEIRVDSRDHTPVTGLFAGTPVLTLDGLIPVEHLTPGDRIVTRSGAVELVDLVTGTAEVTPYSIEPAALGGGRPEEQILLPSDQHVLVRDWRAEALFGRPQAMVQVAKLADGEYICALPARRMRVFTLVFHAPEVFYASGLELVSALDVHLVAA